MEVLVVKVQHDFTDSRSAFPYAGKDTQVRAGRDPSDNLVQFHFFIYRKGAQVILVK